ncbi:MAG: epoxide hydrolase 4 [Abditibacteriota bacterium]|nr:epoxide hydrolase 4 [Abditibacteriota bacterium]
MAKVRLDDIVQHRFARVNGVRLHYVESVEGGAAEAGADLQRPVVLLLHGFPDFWYGWRRQIPALREAGFRVIAPDLRGYNLSSKPRSVFSYSLDRLGGDVVALIRHLGLQRAHLVGHDWGGVIAYWVAQHHPSAVERLAILNAPHPAVYQRELRTLDQLRRSSYALFFQLPWLPERLLRADDFAALRAVWRFDPQKRSAWNREDLQRSVEAISQPGALSAALNYYRALLRSPRQMRRSRRTIEHPTLLLWGEGDRYLSPRLLDDLGPWLPNLRIERFPEASHWLQHDAAHAVNERLIAFFSDAASYSEATSSNNEQVSPSR